MDSSSIKVWDLFIRFFHWTLVAAFLISYLTEGETNLHFYSGWYIASLLCLRVIWGFIGSKYARFTDFIKPPSEVLKYTQQLISRRDGSAKKYTGHNPLGGLMVIALILSLTFTCISGVMLYTSEGQNLFAFVDQPLLQSHEEAEEHEVTVHTFNQDEDDEHHYFSSNENSEENDDEEEFWEEIHELFSNLTLFLILLHVAGVIFSSRLQKENLVKAMISGRKNIN